jgi:hypothetical protein
MFIVHATRLHFDQQPIFIFSEDFEEFQDFPYWHNEVKT